MTPWVILINSFAVVLSIAFLIIIAWYDARRLLNLLFMAFLVSIIFWNMGQFYGQFIVELASETQLTRPFILDVIAFSATNAGFLNATIALYALFIVLADIKPRYFGWGISAVLSLVIFYNLLPIVIFNDDINASNLLTNQSISNILFISFNFLTLFVLWRFQKKIESNTIKLGAVIFIIGQLLSYLNPLLVITSLSTTISSIGGLLIAFGFIEQELFQPLRSQNKQLDTLHQVGLAITKGISTNTVLSNIAVEITRWLNADAACIHLYENSQLNWVATVNLPTHDHEFVTKFTQSIPLSVAKSERSLLIENFNSHEITNDLIDIPYAENTFGSIISVPLKTDNDILGVLTVITGKRNRPLNTDDVRLTELLSSQAVVAISQGELFAEQKALNQEIQNAHGQLRGVLESTQNPVLAVDRSFDIIFHNAATLKLLDIVPNQQEQLNIFKLISDNNFPSNWRSFLRTMQKTHVFVYETRLKGHTFMCHITQIGEKRPLGWVAVLHDISELKELDRIKGEMIRMTSHDLKNPLQAALANVDLLRDDLDDNPHDEMSVSVENIEKQLVKMNRIISGILDLERVREQFVAPDSISIRELIANCVQDVYSFATENQIHINVHVQSDEKILGNVIQIERAIVNLLENGIKFSRPQTDVYLHVRDEDDAVILSIRDTGIGIPKKDQERIFERFYRASQPGAEHISGTGLGLSLVKAVIEMHKGTVWVESEFGAGSTFFVSLPITSHSH